MNKYVLKILGMRCGMCELHVEEAISKNINVKKVKANPEKPHTQRSQNHI